MRLVKILILILITMEASAQTVQQLPYKDYSAPYQMNIGSGILKTTDGSAYLEIGKSSGSTKGILIPRGNKDAVISPSPGLLFYDIPTSKIWWYTAGGWKSGSDDAGSATTVSNLYKTGDTVYYTVNGVTQWFTTGAGSSTTVNKFNNRTGNVMPQSGDYTWSMIGGKPTSVSYFSDAYTQAQINALLATKLAAGDTANISFRLDSLAAKLMTSPAVSGSFTFHDGLEKNSQNEVRAKFSAPIWNANKLQGFYVDPVAPGEGSFLGFDSTYGIWRAMKPGSVAAASNARTEAFVGTTNNTFTVSQTPLATSIEVYVNGQKIPKSYYSLTVNTVQINAASLGFSSDTGDRIEIKYQPNN